jgi:arylsulfatase A-like enzyme
VLCENAQDARQGLLIDHLLSFARLAGNNNRPKLTDNLATFQTSAFEEAEPMNQKPKHDLTSSSRANVAWRAATVREWWEVLLSAPLQSRLAPMSVLSTSWLVAVVLAVFVLSHPTRAADTSRPNILWLVSEDIHTFLGCYGDPRARTPTIDRLASQGVLFERCFTQPVCAPSRFTLISGMYAASCGPAEHMRAQGKIPEWLKGFPAYLRSAGYYTTNNAKTDYNSPIKIQEAWNESSRKAHWRKRTNPQQSFFSVFNHEITHESCLFPEREQPLTFPSMDPARVRIPPYQPDTPEIRADWARYYNHLSLLDGQIASKLQDLEKEGLAENTIVFYYSDNGGVLPRSKRFLQESGTHVPLIVYFPPRWRHLAPAAPGSRIKDPVHFVDFAPTILSLAGVKIPPYMQGRAFAGPGRGKPNEFVLCTRDRMDERYDMMRSVMTSRWLYIRNYRPDLPYVQPLEYMFQARGYQSWARLAAEGKLTAATAQFWGPKPVEELYDMPADPDSIKNLAGDPAHGATLQQMRAALKKRILEINDNGFIPEGSTLEGYDASRLAGAYPLERVLALATLASERDPARLPQLIKALGDESEPIRWWAAQGCAMLGAKAAPAETALRQRLSDPSGAVQVAAAEALARLGKIESALPVLERWLRNTEKVACALQAANVLDRMGEGARPALPLMKRLLKQAEAREKPFPGHPYPQRILKRIIDVLEGRTPPLVYPTR